MHSLAIGQKALLSPADVTVTVLAFDAWDGVPVVLVDDPSTPNPAGIPGLGQHWVAASDLTPLVGNHDLSGF
jgi:hypothetical protein